MGPSLFSDILFSEKNRVDLIFPFNKMSTSVGVGISRKADGVDAGREASILAQERAKLRSCDLAFIFASSRYEPGGILKGAREALGAASIIGCTDAGEITSQGISEHSVVVAAIKSDLLHFSMGLGEGISKDARRAGFEAVRGATKTYSEKRRILLILPDGLTGNGADVVRGAQEVMGTSFPIVGGSSADDYRFKKTHQFFNDKVLSDSVPALLLSGDICIGIGAKHGWEPLGKPRRVSKSKANIVWEIDNEPAIKFYEHYFGKEMVAKASLAEISISYPLGIPIPGEEGYLLRNLLHVESDGRLLYSADVPEGSSVRLMMGNKKLAIQAARRAALAAKEAIGNARARLAVIFNSSARHKLLGRLAEEELNCIRKAVGEDVPLIGFYDYGEQAPLGPAGHPGQTYFHNETIVVMVVGEAT